MLHTDLAAEDIHNVEIVTDGDIDADAILSTVTGDDENAYVVVSEPGNHLRIIDSSTGLTVATMPADSGQLRQVTLSEVETEECITVVHAEDSLDALTASAAAAQQEMGAGDGEKAESSTMVLIPSSSLSSSRRAAAVVTTTAETITVHTEAGPITVVAGEEVADAVKHAMMVADVVEIAGAEDSSVTAGAGGELEVVLTQAGQMPAATEETTVETQQQ